MARALIALFFFVFSASAGFAAPFDCYRSSLGAGAILQYDLDRADTTVTFRDVEAGVGDCNFIGSATVDLLTRSGRLSLTPDETYLVTLRGDIGERFFEERQPLFSGDGYDFIFRVPPDYRLDFRPEGGRNLDFTYPNGFSIAFAGCPILPGTGGACEGFGPFFLVIDEVGDRIGDFILSDGGAPHVFGAVAVPAALPLMAGGLALMGWLARRRRITRA